MQHVPKLRYMYPADAPRPIYDKFSTQLGHNMSLRFRNMKPGGHDR